MWFEFKIQNSKFKIQNSKSACNGLAGGVRRTLSNLVAVSARAQSG
jgi:hypothetical protein